MEHHDADQPLLANDRNNREDVPYESSDESANGLGGLFIWALTFAAGISGLLFGYEYEVFSMQHIIMYFIVPLLTVTTALVSFLRLLFPSRQISRESF